MMLRGIGLRAGSSLARPLRLAVTYATESTGGGADDGSASNGMSSMCTRRQYARSHCCCFRQLERTAAQQLYAEIFKDSRAPGTGQPGSSQASTSSTTNTTASATPNTAAAAAKSTLWQQLFAKRVLSKPDEAPLAESTTQYAGLPMQEPDEDDELTAEQQFLNATTHAWDRLIPLRPGAPSSRRSTATSSDDALGSTITPEALSLYKLYPPRIKFWLKHAFVCISCRIALSVSLVVSLCDKYAAIPNDWTHWHA
jgi:hypothetical protein